MPAVREHTSGEVVARIAGRVVGEHKDDVRVGYAEAFHGSVPAFVVVVGTLFRTVIQKRRTFPTHLPYANSRIQAKAKHIIPTIRTR